MSSITPSKSCLSISPVYHSSTEFTYSVRIYKEYKEYTPTEYIVYTEYRGFVYYAALYVYPISIQYVHVLRTILLECVGGMGGPPTFRFHLPPRMWLRRRAKAGVLFLMELECSPHITLIEFNRSGSTIAVLLFRQCDRFDCPAHPSHILCLCLCHCHCHCHCHCLCPLPSVRRRICTCIHNGATSAFLPVRCSDPWIQPITAAIARSPLQDCAERNRTRTIVHFSGLSLRLN